MPRRPTAGTVQFGAELDESIVTRWRAYCSRRGGIRYCTELAMSWFMDRPDGPPEVPPPPPPEPRKTRKGGK